MSTTHPLHCKCGKCGAPSPPKQYKPKLKKCGVFWLVDDGSSGEPLSVPDAKLRRLAIRWASKKNVEWVNRIT